MSQQGLPPETPDLEDMSHAPSRKGLFAVLAIVAVMLGGLVHSVFTLEPPPPPPKPVHVGPPALKLEPSAMVPGPMQIPRSLKDGDEARADEAVLFRATVNGTGYVLVALELENGQLVPFYGQKPTAKPITDSVLLSEDQVAIGYPLAKHKDKVVGFVGILSLVPYTEIPKSIPREPKTFPPPGTTQADVQHPIPNSSIVAWDRFSVSVTKQPPPTP